MSAHILVGPGMKLVASVVFHVRGPLFVTIHGPAAVSFGAGWGDDTQEIENTSGNVWQFSVHASHHGPIGSEVPVTVVQEAGSLTRIAVGDPTAVEAFLTIRVEPIW